MRHRNYFSLIALTIIMVISGLIVITQVNSFSAASSPGVQTTRIAPTLPFAEDVSSEFSGASLSVYSNYVRVADYTESISMRIPSEWRDVESGEWILQGKDVGLFIAASPDLDAFYNSEGVPGVFFGASRDLAGSVRVSNPALMINPAIPQLLSNQRGNNLKKCLDKGRFDYKNEFYRGQYDLYVDCDQHGQRKLVVVTMPAHQEFITYLRISGFNQGDLDAAAHILDTYQVLNPSLKDEHDH
jgi:hypothetical protein